MVGGGGREEVEVEILAGEAPRRIRPGYLAGAHVHASPPIREQPPVTEQPRLAEGGGKTQGRIKEKTGENHTKGKQRVAGCCCKRTQPPASGI